MDVKYAICDGTNRIVVNGILDIDSTCVLDEETNRYEISVRNEDVINVLLKTEVKELERYFLAIEFERKISFVKFCVFTVILVSPYAVRYALKIENMDTKNKTLSAGYLERLLSNYHFDFFGDIVEESGSNNDSIEEEEGEEDFELDVFYDCGSILYGDLGEYGGDDTDLYFIFSDTLIPYVISDIRDGSEWDIYYDALDFRKLRSFTLAKQFFERYKKINKKNLFTEVYRNVGVTVGGMLLIDVINLTEKKINDALSDAENYLIEVINPDSLVTYFHFPAEIKISCKQYLTYFSQFLHDLGIRANCEIIDKGYTETLLKVTPTNKDEALSNIQNAILAYISAPGNPYFSADNDNTSLAVLQWKANVSHLESQIALSNAIIQAKDATINALNFKTFLLEEKARDSVNHINEEPVIKGIVSLKKYDGKFFTFDFAELFRRMKRKYL